MIKVRSKSKVSECRGERIDFLVKPCIKGEVLERKGKFIDWAIEVSLK